MMEHNLNTHGKLIEWNQTLSVGIEEIDEQHRMLVELLNQLHTSIVEHRSFEQVPAILDRLIEYTRIHFAVEESLMRLFEYPDYEEHKHKHEQLVDEVVRLRHRVVDEGRPVTFELLHFLKKWLTVHIQDTDTQYTAYFLARGVQATYKKKGWFKRIWGN